MTIATATAREVTHGPSRPVGAGTATPGSLVFLGCLWFSLFFGVMVLLVLIVDTAIEGAPRFDSQLVTELQLAHPTRGDRLPRRHPRHRSG